MKWFIRCMPVLGLLALFAVYTYLKDELPRLVSAGPLMPAPTCNAAGVGVVQEFRLSQDLVRTDLGTAHRLLLKMDMRAWDVVVTKGDKVADRAPGG